MPFDSVGLSARSSIPCMAKTRFGPFSKIPQWVHPVPYWLENPSVGLSHSPLVRKSLSGSLDRDASPLHLENPVILRAALSSDLLQLGGPLLFQVLAIFASDFEPLVPEHLLLSLLFS